MGTFDIERAQREVAVQGFSVVDDVLSPEFVSQLRAAIYRVQDQIVAEVGNDRLTRAGERGTLRLLFKYEPIFFELLMVPELLRWLEVTLGDTAILHCQNGFILPSDMEEPPEIFQHTFHRDFPRYLDGYVASTNIMFAIDAYSSENGATIAIPGSQQRSETIDTSASQIAVPMEADPGSMILFDSTLWHAAGRNTSGNDRVSINHQFTRSWIKQQIDYVRAIGADTISLLPERTKQILGWYTRVVTSLDEYYRPEDERLYRRGQG